MSKFEGKARCAALYDYENKGSLVLTGALQDGRQFSISLETAIIALLGEEALKHVWKELKVRKHPQIYAGE